MIILCIILYSSPVRSSKRSVLICTDLGTFKAFYYMFDMFWTSITPQLLKKSSSNFQCILVVWRPQNARSFKILGARFSKLVFFRIRRIECAGWSWPLLPASSIGWHYGDTLWCPHSAILYYSRILDNVTFPVLRIRIVSFMRCLF